MTQVLELSRGAALVVDSGRDSSTMVHHLLHAIRPPGSPSLSKRFYSDASSSPFPVISNPLLHMLLPLLFVAVLLYIPFLLLFLIFSSLPLLFILLSSSSENLVFLFIYFYLSYSLRFSSFISDFFRSLFPFFFLHCFPASLYIILLHFTIGPNIRNLIGL